MLGVLPGLIGTIQATEAIKLILGAGETLVGRLLLFDALRDELPHAEAAGAIRTARSAAITRRSQTLIDYEQFCGIAPPREAPARPCCRPSSRRRSRS